MKSLFLLIFFISILIAGETKDIRVGIYENAPKIFLDSSGEPLGFFVDVLDEIAKKENWKLRYIDCQWQECLLMLKSGELDILPDVAYSKERDVDFLFNKEVVLPNWSVVFTHKKSSISSILDLENKKIALLEHSIQQEQIKETLELFGVKSTFIGVKSFKDSFDLVEKKEVDAAIVNRHFGELNKDKYNLKETNILLNPAALMFAFSDTLQNEALSQRVDFHLKTLKEQKESLYYKSIEKWLKIEEHFKIPLWLKISLFAILLLLAISAMIIAFFRYMLKLKTKEIIEKTAKFEQSEIQKLQDYKKILFALISMIEQRDSYTAGHSQRVARYCELIAREMGYDEEDCKLVYKAGILHDIGKIAIPDAVLLKPDKLSALEYTLIKEHVSIGYKILQDVPMFEKIAQIVMFHHEKYDGSGYPNAAKADEIPPLSRIMMVADAFDAMTTNRIYKHKKSIKEALLEIESLSQKHYHPEVVKSALIALSNVDTGEEFNQNPITPIEEHRFVYFYKDAITDLYNGKYLEEIFINNQGKYNTAAILSLHKFDTYNKKYSWESGNKTLREFAALLCSFFEKNPVFRLRANDFVILLQKEDKSYENIIKAVEEFTKDKGLEFDFHLCDLQKNEIDSFEDFKKFL